MVVSSSTNAFSKEMNIRKRIASIICPGETLKVLKHASKNIPVTYHFNKREDDFPSLRDYNDYLEEVEDMTFNLIEGIDVPAIEAKIARYQEENAEQIVIAQARRAEELAAALKASKGPANPSDTTDVDAGLSSQMGMSVTGQGQYAPTAHPGGALGQPRPTGMAPQPLPLGVAVDHMHGYGTEDEESLKIRAERAARAGGWTLEISKKRAFEETFSSMWI